MRVFPDYFPRLALRFKLSITRSRRPETSSPTVVACLIFLSLKLVRTLHNSSCPEPRRRSLGPTLNQKLEGRTACCFPSIVFRTGQRGKFRANFQRWKWRKSCSFQRPAVAYLYSTRVASFDDQRKPVGCLTARLAVQSIKKSNQKNTCIKKAEVVAPQTYSTGQREYHPLFTILLSVYLVQIPGIM